MATQRTQRRNGWRLLAAIAAAAMLAAVGDGLSAHPARAIVPSPLFPRIGSSQQVLFGVHADRRFVRLRNEDRDAVLEEAELFQAFRALQRRRGQAMERVEGDAPVCVESDVLVTDDAGVVAVIGNGEARKIERMVIGVAHHLHDVRIVYVLRGGADA